MLHERKRWRKKVQDENVDLTVLIVSCFGRHAERWDRGKGREKSGQMETVAKTLISSLGRFYHQPSNTFTCTALKAIIR